ncbi:glycerate kinase [Erysipelothrix larvae]|uniref:glycerate kinase family protein n=1 Tax=Erysipelothrix larvae TaxID=1514105 RepID=UPI0012FD11E3|nr:glycerate kinase [Erysipelothrix larvae]
MKVVSLIDSFKHSFPSQQGCEIVKRAISGHDVSAFCVADGGEGTTQILTELYQGDMREVLIVDPCGRPLRSPLGYVKEKNVAILESAEGAGIQKVRRDELNPYTLSSYGVGLHLKEALNLGVDTIILGLGGSATLDCGYGMLMALGLRFIDTNGNYMTHFDVRLGDVKTIEWDQLDPRLNTIHMILASDVTNPLLKEKGSVYVFGKQKGLDPQHFESYDLDMAHFAKMISDHAGVDGAHTPGAGAAGGIGFALASICDCEFVSGVDLILNDPMIQQALDGADVVLTGEGCIDAQSLDGKLISGVIRECQKRSVGCVLVCGHYDLDTSLDGVKDVIVISDPDLSLDEALDQGPENLELAISKYFNTMKKV